MQSAWRHVPHAITLSALTCGCSALHFVHEGKITLAGIAILAAAMLDALDGLIARRFKLETDIGLELDSLADLVNFGVAPAFLIYESHGSSFGALGAVASLSYVMAACWRLAKFNVASSAAGFGGTQHVSKGYGYSGMTTTAAAVVSVILVVFNLPKFASEATVIAQFILAGAMIAPWPFPNLATVLKAILSVRRRR